MTYAFLNNSTHITFSLDGVGRVGKEENKQTKQVCSGSGSSGLVYVGYMGICMFMDYPLLNLSKN